MLRQMLSGLPNLRILEAETGADGLRLARREAPHAILLELRLPDMQGSDLLDRLADDPATIDIPVIVCTSSILATADTARLDRAFTTLSKASLTRETMAEWLQRAWNETSLQPQGGVSG